MTIELYKNSFVTLEEAQQYFEERYNAQKWFELQDSDKENLLITSSKKINKFDFAGKKLDSSQPMKFPRDFPMPQDIKDAVCEEALSMAVAGASVHYQNQKNNIKSLGLGSGSVSYGDAVNQMGMISEEAAYLVNTWVKKGYKFSI